VTEFSSWEARLFILTPCWRHDCIWLDSSSTAILCSRSFQKAFGQVLDYVTIMLRQHHSTSSLSHSTSIVSTFSTASPLLLSLTPSFCHSWIKTHLVHKSFPPYTLLYFLRTDSMVFWLLPVLLRFFIFVFSFLPLYFFQFVVQYVKLFSFWAYYKYLYHIVMLPQ